MPFGREEGKTPGAVRAVLSGVACPALPRGVRLYAVTSTFRDVNFYPNVALYQSEAGSINFPVPS